MKLGEALQSTHVLVDLGVVLHGAGTKGIKTVVYTVDALAESGIMAGKFIF